MKEIKPPAPTPYEPRVFQKEVIDKLENMSPKPNYKQWQPRQYAKPFVGIDLGAGDDKSIAVHGIPDKKGGFKIIAIDEWGTWPSYKWYRNPIKWWKFRKVMKVIERNMNGQR